MVGSMVNLIMMNVDGVLMIYMNSFSLNSKKLVMFFGCL